MLVHQSGAPTWRLHSANNSEIVCRTDLRLGETVYVLVFYNMSFFWLFSLNGLEVIFFLWRDSESDLYIKKNSVLTKEVEPEVSNYLLCRDTRFFSR